MTNSVGACRVARSLQRDSASTQTAPSALLPIYTPRVVTFRCGDIPLVGPSQKIPSLLGSERSREGERGGWGVNGELSQLFRTIAQTYFSAPTQQT